MKQLTLYDIVIQQIGPIVPYSDTRIDEKRLENLEEFLDLLEMMLVAVEEVAQFKDSRFISSQVMGRRAHNYLKDIGSDYYER